jgi:hypothetical protein
MVLAALADESHGPASVARYGWLPDRVAFVGVLGGGDAFDGTGVHSGSIPPRDVLRGTGTLVALAPDFAACFVVPRSPTTSGRSRSPTTATRSCSARCR